MVGTSDDVTVRMKKKLLRWFGHVKKYRIKYTGGKLHEKQENSPKRMYKELNDSRWGERSAGIAAFGAPFFLTSHLGSKRQVKLKIRY